jgi:hypothetical protein
MDTAPLPGAALIEQGLRDVAAGVESEAALLVRIGAPRLRRLGFVVPSDPARQATSDPSPEHRLYTLLSLSHPDSAHSRYNALIRLLVSFERARACVR